MIKKILPTMIGAALAGGMTSATADITVFGHIDTSIDFSDQDGGSDTQMQVDSTWESAACILELHS